MSKPLNERILDVRRSLEFYPFPLDAGQELPGFPPPASDLNSQGYVMATAALALAGLGYLRITSATAMLMEPSPNDAWFVTIFDMSTEQGTAIEMYAISELWKILKAAQSTYDSAIKQLCSAAPAWNIERSVDEDFGGVDEVWSYSKIGNRDRLLGPYKIRRRAAVVAGNVRRHIQVDPVGRWAGHVKEGNVRLRDNTGRFYRSPMLAEKFGQCNPDGSNKARGTGGPGGHIS